MRFVLKAKDEHNIALLSRALIPGLMQCHNCEHSQAVYIKPTLLNHAWKIFQLYRVCIM